MKKITLGLAAVLISAGMSAQNIKDNKVSFSYIQLPGSPLPSGTENFSTSLDQDMLIQLNEDSTERYELKLEEARKRYEEKMKTWKEEKAKIDKAYYASMANYEKLVAAGNTTAQKPVPPAENSCPCIDAPPAPFLANEVEESLISGLTIPGFSQGGGANIELVFEGFTKGPIKENITTKDNVKSYTYSYQYKYPVKFVVTDEGGAVIRDEYINGSNNFKAMSTSKFTSQYDYKAWQIDGEEPFWRSMENSVKNSSVSAVNGILSDKYGYPTKSRMIEIYTAKDKNHDYSDLVKAYTDAQDGYLMLNGDREKNSAMSKLANAIQQWESTLKESDINNKKARISKKVTGALYANLAEAYSWMDDYSNAQLYANKAINLGVGKFKRHAQNILPFIQGQKARFLANE